MSRHMEIAKTIVEQLGRMRMMRLGATKMAALSETDGRLGGLSFNASLFGRQRCSVTIVLTPSDTYSYSVTTPRSKMVLAKGEGIYCDQLGDAIDLGVENHFSNIK